MGAYRSRTWLKSSLCMRFFDFRVFGGVSDTLLAYVCIPLRVLKLSLLKGLKPICLC